MNQYPFYTALSLSNELYGVELDEDAFETLGLSAWNKIGNKNTQVYRMCATPQKSCDGCGWFVQIPCNATQIEAVTVDGEDFQETDSMLDDAGWVRSSIENFIEGQKGEHHELYIPGRYIHYKELGDKLYFQHPYAKVNILYKGQYADEDGLPYINMKEAEAIAAYCAYMHDFKNARKTKDASLFQIAQLQEMKWKKLCSAARVPESISQNSLNNILQASLSWDHARYGIDYKPIR